MKFLVLALLLVSFAQSAFAQNSPPEARAFTPAEQGKSLSELANQNAPPPPKVTVQSPATTKIKQGFTSFNNLSDAWKREKPVEVTTPDGRRPKVAIWLPPEFRELDKKWPLIVFSHGFGGCARQAVFLTQYLSDHGYIVVAPDHADADCRRQLSGSMGATRGRDMRAGKAAWPDKPFRTPEAWNDKTEADRRDDVLYAVSYMLGNLRYQSHVDLNNIGLIGHSLGGYTALGIAGGWPAWKDKRFKAVLALSPYAAPFITQKSLSKIDVPIMYQGGTRDQDITPLLKKQGGGYAQSKAPKYFVEFEGADHFVWTDLDKRYQRRIDESAVQFFDKYLKHQPVTIEYMAGKNQVATFWKDEGAK